MVGPTAIFTYGQAGAGAAGAIAVAAYSYMALVPLIQPPIMKSADHGGRRSGKSVRCKLRTVSKREKILFPAVLLLLVALLLPDAAPLLGMFCFGNLMRESGGGASDDTVQNVRFHHRHHLPRAVGGREAAADKFRSRRRWAFWCWV